MKKHQREMLPWIDNRLRDILAAPRMWGSDDAIEAQVLLLLQFRRLVMQPGSDPDSVVDEYMDYLAREYPKTPNQPLHQIVPTDRLGLNIAKELKKVVAVFGETFDKGDHGKGNRN